MPGDVPFASVSSPPSPGAGWIVCIGGHHDAIDGRVACPRGRIVSLDGCLDCPSLIALESDRDEAWCAARVEPDDAWRLARP